MAGLHQSLVELADDLANKIRENISNENLPKVIADAIEISNVETQENTSWIDVSISTKKAPMAGAFEFGSGEHNPDSPSRYRIPNEGNDWVAFPEERWPGVTNPESLPRLPDGRFIFRFVMHPGVEARPYIRPAIESKVFRDLLRKKLAAAAKTEILLLYKDKRVEINA